MMSFVKQLLVRKGPSSLADRVGDVMERKVLTARPGDTSGQCLHAMAARRVRHLPVIEGDGIVVGMVSIGDVLDEIVQNQQATIDSLVDYIRG